MEEVYKEMYIQLYRSMTFLQGVLMNLSDGAESALGETMDTYMSHFDDQLEGKSKLEERFKHKWNND